LDASIELLNINGQKVLEGSIAEQRTGCLDVSCFPNGIYLLKVTGEYGVTLKKVVIKH